MSEGNQDLSRREFTADNSTANASPLPPNPEGSVQEAKTKAKKNIDSVKIYFITHECIGCHVCLTFCPVQAIHYGDCRNEIDQSKCTRCGICYEECPISVISETEI